MIELIGLKKSREDEGIFASNISLALTISRHEIAESTETAEVSISVLEIVLRGIKADTIHCYPMRLYLP